jgi:hypothetical protein
LPNDLSKKLVRVESRELAQHPPLPSVRPIASTVFDTLILIKNALFQPFPILKPIVTRLMNKNEMLYRSFAFSFHPEYPIPILVPELNFLRESIWKAALAHA